MRASRHPYGLRLRGANPIKVRSAEVVPQVYLKDAVQSDRNWESLWNDFCWLGWIKPQIDLAVANGANCIKVSWGGWDGATQISSTATTLTRMRAFNDYLRTLGLASYWSLLGSQQAFTSSGALMSGGIIGEMQQVLALIETFPNAVGCDLLNEVNYSGPSSWGSGAATSAFSTSMEALFPVARAAAPTLPLTVSVSVEQASDWANGYNGYLAAAAPFVDFHDVHPYYGGDGNSAGVRSIPALADLAPMISASWFKGRWFAGEVGVDQALPSATRTAFVAGIGALTADPSCYGANLFCLADYDIADGLAGRYGASDETVSNPRADILEPFASTWQGHLA